MSDKPILFSAPMVRALLREIDQAGSGKTQTRRVAKFVEPHGDDWHMHNAGGGMFASSEDTVRRDGHYYAPYAVDDRVYVREAWRAQDAFDDLSPAEIGQQFKDETGAAWCPVFYEADQKCDGSSVDIWQQSPPGRLRQGMHMPRWASRITLIVTDVRVQRLQEISEADAIAEGIAPLPSGRFHCGHDEEGEITCKSPITAYGWLWNSLNGERPGCHWQDNPWVAAYSFRPILGNIDQIGGDA